MRNNQLKLALRATAATVPVMDGWPYVYFWNRMGRKGQRCRVLIRAKAMNTCLLEFEDGHLAITSRNRDPASASAAGDS